MKKIGIITFYYANINYGGILQAYSLVKFIENLGHDAKQICRKRSANKNDVNIMIKLCKKITTHPLLFLKMIWHNQKKNLLKNKLKLRYKKFNTFEKSIPHSNEVYTSEDIYKCVDDYDIFITGSDQVWNMNWYSKEYFLAFVPDGKRKISYAASMPSTNLSDEQKNIVCEHLKSFDEISVREKETAVYLEELTGRKAEWVLDPTLLLSKAEWEKICFQRVVKEKYIFCYFLGTEKIHRNIAKKFAEKIGYKIVTLPHLAKVNINDLAFGDMKLYDISPEQFISLIKYAEYVITDSFHAAVFSNIYQTKYFVFDRIGIGEMSSRIKSLVSLTGEEFRFCTCESQSLEYMLSKKDIDVPQLSDELLKMKEKSIEFLKRNLV